jgi:NAD(P)-dependent dehydrogenase (short-subunit alcohol dehydrogenase family)
MFDLKDQRVLVVGGSSGIGEGVAKACCDAGAQVTIASRSEAKLAAAVARLGHGVRSLATDTRDDAAVEAMWREAGEVDHVVVSAAEVRIAPVKTLTIAEAQAAMESKFWGAYRVARAARVRDGGSITLISGAAAARATKGRALQTAINAAVEALARALSVELAPVRVNAVSPGVVATPLLDGLDAERRAALEAAVRALPTGRMGQAADIALQVLACMGNPFMTGSVVYVDGGYLA